MTMQVERKNVNGRFVINETGSTLVFVIIAMVVLAVLGVGTYTLTSTSQLNQARAQNDAKAYYISESCNRIAAAEYKAAAAHLKNSTLVALNNKSFTMPDNQGVCSVEIYPYWLYLPNSIGPGATTVTLYIPGLPPRIRKDSTNAIELHNGLRLKLYRPGDIATTAVAVATSAVIGSFSGSSGGTPVTFNLQSGDVFDITLNSGDQFYMGYAYTNVTMTGQTLVLGLPNAHAGEIFPSETGLIFLDESCQGDTPIVYSYSERDDSENGRVKLTQLTYQGNCSPAPSPFVGGEKVVYTAKNIAFRSKSTYGN